MTDLSIIIPCFQEAENLKILLPRLLKTLQGMEIKWEAVIVDAEQPLDDTREVCTMYADRGVRCIKRTQGSSFGSAVRSGIAFANGKHLLFMDGDGSHDPELIPTLYSYRNEADVVVGSRYTKGGVTENSWLLKLMSRALNFAYSVVFRINCKDISNSFKLYEGEKIRRLVLRSNNFDLIEEILIKLKRDNKNLKILEIPCVFHNRTHGVTKRKLIFFMLSFGITLIRLWFIK